MPSFRFSLQPLLDERLRVEEAAHSVLGHLEQAHESAREELAATDAAIAACTALLAAQSSHSLQAVLAHAGLLQRRRIRATVSVDQAQSAREAAGQELERARLARELLETMRRSAHGAFVHEQLVADEHEFDEANRAGSMLAQQ